MLFAANLCARFTSSVSSPCAEALTRRLRSVGPTCVYSFPGLSEKEVNTLQLKKRASYASTVHTGASLFLH